MNIILHQLDKTTELLQYFTSTGVTFAADHDSISATDIGTEHAFEAGDYILVAASAQTANNTTWKVLTSSVDELIVDGSITDDNAGETIKIKQEYIGAWVDVRCYAKLVATIVSSGDCSLKIEQSGDESSVDYTTTTSVTGGTNNSATTEVFASYARLRITNGEADQTSLRSYLHGRVQS